MPKDSDHLKEIRKRVSKAPEKPGIYRWLNKDGDLLYVGKAKNLKKRLKSYVQKDPDKSIGPWKLSLIKHIADYDITTTSTELEALILETNLIKEHRPKYNVLMKDDKNYVYVRIGINNPYPDVDIVRRTEDDKAKYFGPFIKAYQMKKTLELLDELFGYKACQKSIDQINKDLSYVSEKPCLDYQLGKCNGLCVGKISADDYKQSIEQVIRFLRGDRTETIKKLQEVMQKAAVNKKFEKAAKLRDTLAYLKSLEEQQIVSDTSKENTDAIGVALQSDKAQVVILRERNGRLIGELSYAVKGSADTAENILSQFLPQYYEQSTDIPDTILIGEELEDEKILEAWLMQIKEKHVEIRVPERGKKSKLLIMAEANAKEKVQQQLAKWEAAAKNAEEALKKLTEVLDLPALPKRIEGYDISHHSGTETVGSMVVMKNGKTANDQYRSFTIRTMKEGEVDDYKALKEVLTRRLKYLVQGDDQITVDKLKKKERDTWVTDNKPLLAIPKDWRQEVINLKKGTTELLTLDLRKSAKHKVVFGSLRITTKSKEDLHKALDVVEELLGKHEIYLLSPDCNDLDLLSLHSLVESTKDLPKAFKVKKGTMLLHRRKTPKDISLSTTPDLLVIDGGKGQLNIACHALKDLKLEIPIIGLAKREEEIFEPGNLLPVAFPKDSQALFLLMRLRDEAHRFANSHREKRAKHTAMASSLDEVEGIGEQTKYQLLKKFGSVARIKEADDKQLLNILSKRQLTLLRHHL